MILTGAGLAMGLTGTLALSRRPSALLYGVTPTEPFTTVSSAPGTAFRMMLFMFVHRASGASFGNSLAGPQVFTARRSLRGDRYRSSATYLELTVRNAGFLPMRFRELTIRSALPQSLQITLFSLITLRGLWLAPENRLNIRATCSTVKMFAAGNKFHHRLELWLGQL